jgi:RNA exonuclease NGL2
MANYVRPMLNLHTEVVGKKSFTVMSYNVLAQGMINRSWYQSCSPSCLRWNNRKVSLTKEIAQLDADIVCLQEVSNYDTFWEKTMRQLGYLGKMKIRPGGKQDGCAIFYKDYKFEEIDYETINYDDLCTISPNDIAELRRFNVAMLLALRFKDEINTKSTSEATSETASTEENPGIIIGNTHLFWNYRYSYARFRQALMFVEKAVNFREKLNLPVILCGDWNLTPDSTIYQVLTQGQISEDHVMDNFTYFADEESADLVGSKPNPQDFTDPQKKLHNARVAHVRDLVSGHRQTLPLLHSVYSTYQTLDVEDTKIKVPYTGEPTFTNFTESFKGTLDYIFVLGKSTPEGDAANRKTVTPTKIMHLPYLDTLTSHVALPNDMFASDHVSILCEFQI